jgi:hypothetical protein
MLVRDVPVNALVADCGAHRRIAGKRLGVVDVLP